MTKTPAPIKDPKLIVAEAYDQIAERYLEWRGQQPREGELARWLGLLSDEVQPGARVLDIGCGAGIPLTEALSKTFNVTGVDISARQIELAVGNVPDARFIRGDVTMRDFDGPSFDAAVASYSLIRAPNTADYSGQSRGGSAPGAFCSPISDWAIRKWITLKIGSVPHSFGAASMLIASVRPLVRQGLRSSSRASRRLLKMPFHIVFFWCSRGRTERSDVGEVAADCTVYGTLSKGTS